MEGSSPLSPDMPSSELAKRLRPQLEAIANLHYLLDMHVVDPGRLRALRKMEDDVFHEMLELVTACAANE